MHHRRTPWKKSRTHGDIYGGRGRRKLADNIFSRAHSIARPSMNDALPIVIEDNPSSELFFPLTADEVVKALKSLPKRDYEGITHLWLRRGKRRKCVNGEQPLATFICGSGVRVITLYAWPSDLTLRFGPKRPSNRVQKEVERFGAVVKKVGAQWIAKFTLPELRHYLIHVLYHEVGHHIDWHYRHWSKANRKQVEDFADQYAFEKTANAKHVFNQLDQTASPTST